MTGPAQPSYAFGEDQYAYTYDTVRRLAFLVRDYPFTKAAVEAALVEIVSQKGILVGATEERDLVLSLGMCGQGVTLDACVAVGVKSLSQKKTEVAIAWIMPKGGECAEVPKDLDVILKEKKNKDNALYLRQSAAVGIGHDLAEQLGTQLYGPGKWMEKYFK